MSDAEEPPPSVDAALAQALWDESADAWERFIEGGFDPYRTALHGPALLEACGDVRGMDLLDLGCGQGWFSRQLAQAGARVTGIDWSARLVAHARRHEQRDPLGIRYEVLDAARLAQHFDPGAFGLVTGCMALMDMPAPGTVLAAACTRLAPGGRIVVSITHPVTDATYRRWKRGPDGAKLALEIDRYFEARDDVLEWNLARFPQRFRTVQYRHTLEQWSRWIETAGLLVRRMREPVPSAEALARHPELADAARVPYFLVLELVPGRATPGAEP